MRYLDKEILELTDFYRIPLIYKKLLQTDGFDKAKQYTLSRMLKLDPKNEVIKEIVMSLKETQEVQFTLYMNYTQLHYKYLIYKKYLSPKAKKTRVQSKNAYKKYYELQQLEYNQFVTGRVNIILGPNEFGIYIAGEKQECPYVYKQTVKPLSRVQKSILIEKILNLPKGSLYEYGFQVLGQAEKVNKIKVSPENIDAINSMLDKIDDKMLEAYYTIKYKLPSLIKNDKVLLKQVEKEPIDIETLRYIEYATNDVRQNLEKKSIKQETYVDRNVYRLNLPPMKTGKQIVKNLMGTIRKSAKTQVAEWIILEEAKHVILMYVKETMPNYKLDEKNIKTVEDLENLVQVLRHPQGCIIKNSRILKSIPNENMLIHFKEIWQYIASPEENPEISLIPEVSVIPVEKSTNILSHKTFVENIHVSLPIQKESKKAKVKRIITGIIR